MGDADFDYVISGRLPEEYNENLVEESFCEGEEEPELNPADAVQKERLDNDSGADDSTSSSDEEEDDTRVEDKEEEEAVRKFLRRTCKCKLRDGNPCSSYLTFEELINHRADILQLTRTEIDLVLLTSIRNSIDVSPFTAKGKPRQCERLTLYFHGNRVCEETFFMIHATGKKKFRNVLQFFKVNRSLTPRVHGNNRKRPWNALSFEDTRNFKKFILNYASKHATNLPGRYPGFKNHMIQLLESHMTKKKLHEIYSVSCLSANRRVLQYSLFCDLWRKLTPYVIIAKPRTDLCTTCQQNNYLILRSANTEETEKKEKLEVQQEHLYRSDRERLYYRKLCKSAKTEYVTAGKEGRSPKFTHISFDFAQQLQYPSPLEQPGGLYFLTPRKCGLFGICNEALFRQVNYLIDEAISIGKDANTIITLIDHYLGKYLNTPVLYIHADNCVGQNKNQFVIMYFLWRVLTGRNKVIHLGFMIAGHTKFACDACFGILKRKTKRTFISSITDIAQCVTDSAEKSMTNIPEIVGLENGKLLIQYRDWKSFLSSYFKTFPDLTKNHHFQFSAEFPLGEIKVKEFEDSKTVVKNMVINVEHIPSKDLLPPKIYPCGMTKDRQEYLYKEIRKFCRPGTEDLVAPEVH